MDEGKIPQHLSFICAHKLHIQIIALWCYLAVVFNVHICLLLQNLVNKKYISAIGSRYTYQQSWFANKIYPHCVRWYSYSYGNHMYIWAYIKKWLNMDGSIRGFLNGTFIVRVPKKDNLTKKDCKWLFWVFITFISSRL